MKLWFKKTSVPVSIATIQADTVQLWQVTWVSRYGPYSRDTQKEFEVFTSEKEANYFADSLREAYKLLRHTSETNVEVTKRQ